MTAQSTEVTQDVRLKRELGLFSAVNFIISTLIGSGIFVSSSSALQYTGSVGMCLVVWVCAGLVCLLGALVYAELGSVVPRSGAEVAFYMEAFGPLHKFWGPMLGFIYSFSVALFVKSIEVATITLASADYIVELVYSFVCIEAPDDIFIAKRMVALVELGLITYINVTSVKLYVKVQNVFTALKLMVCVIIIVGGIYELCRGNTENISTGFEGTSFEPKNLALAIYSGLWAYDGWTCMTAVTEEVKKPEVNILRSICIGIPFIIAFYVMINVSYMTVLTKDEITSGTAVALVWGQKLLGDFSPIMPLGVAISAFGCAMAIQFGTTRMSYISAMEGHLPEFMSYIHVRRLTPAATVIIQGAIGMVALLIGQIVQLIEFIMFMLWITHGIAMVAMFVLRKTRPDAPRPFRAPITVAVFVILVAIFLTIAPIVAQPDIKYLVALLLIVVAIPLYVVFYYKKYRPSFMDKVTYVAQVLCESVMPARDANAEECHVKES